MFCCLSQADLVGIYRDADIGLVTPLRDGMNLVAKEFVACRVNEPGVLILSAFAGAGEMMKEVKKIFIALDLLKSGLYKNIRFESYLCRLLM